MRAAIAPDFAAEQARLRPENLLYQLTRAMDDLRRARDEGGMVTHPASNRYGRSELQCAEDAIVLSRDLAAALAVAYPRPSRKA